MTIGRRAVLGSAGLLLASPGRAQNRVKAGTVEIEQVQVAFIGSGNLGGGTLQFQGKSHRFTIGGLGIGGIGISKMQATGDVFNMTELRQFAGAYGQARYGMAIADKSAGELWLQNTNGVLLNLKAKRTGLALSLGADAVIIDFKWVLHAARPNSCFSRSRDDWTCTGPIRISDFQPLRDRNGKGCNRAFGRKTSNTRWHGDGADVRRNR